MITETGTTSGNNDTNLASRILMTLHIADRRGYGLCLFHLSKILVCGEVTSETVLGELRNLPGISQRNGIYCLKGREQVLTKTSERLKCHNKHAKAYEAVARRFASEYVSRCPFIKCIAVAGSMASGGFTEKDDIDFNIYVEKGSKYTVYFVGLLLSIKYSFLYRKKPLAECSKTPFLPKLICINVIWEDTEVFPYVRQDEYLAYELLRQKPIFGLEFYREVLSGNIWLKTCFPQIYNLEADEIKTKRTLSGRILRLFYSNPAISMIGEGLCKRISTFLWRLVQFSRRNNPQAIERVRWVTAMQKPYTLFSEKI
ncbi:MAG: hypothetical protein O8C61_05070 [Candidatus Methanoperedens sp.]|nr:hypothetical protein [Candidatus Methanoperedens sp.]